MSGPERLPTPTPWRVNTTKWRQSEILGPDGEVLAVTLPSEGPDGVQIMKANAEFIVRMCNLFGGPNV